VTANLTEESTYLMALSLIPGVGPQTAKLLLAHVGSAKQVLTTPVQQLTKIYGVGMKTAQVIRQEKKAALQKVEQEIKVIEKRGITPVFHAQPDYPSRLREIPDAPLVFYKRGEANLNTRRILAVVGSRNATPYGTRVVQQAIEGLRGRGVLVVSGLAYGIDVLAHRACLQNDVPTVGVLGTALDRIYPALHQTTAMQMLSQNGALLSEFTTQSKVDRNNFPARNRIVAGMSDATLVVEAAVKGGALITAQFANDYNRDVLAVPGRIDDPYSQGCNNLLKRHMAHAYTDPDSMMELLGWDSNEAGKKTQPAAIQTQLFVEFTPEEEQIAAVMRSEEQVHVEHICLRSGLPVSKVLTILMGMELKGGVRSLPGKVYALV
jgi:DNA processing protein